MPQKIMFFLSLLVCLCANANELESQATIESDPSAIVECVNVITGQVYINNIDVISPGKEPIYLGKNYINILQKRTNYDGIYFMAPNERRRYRHSGWEHFSHLLAYVDYDDRKKQKFRRLDVYEPSGVFLSYGFRKVKNEVNIFQNKEKRKRNQKDFENRKNQAIDLSLHKQNGAFVNTSRGMISASTNYINNKIKKLNEHELKVYSVDGTIRKYVREEAGDYPFFLEYEILPNGNKIKYQYDFKWNHPSKIESLNPKGDIYSSIKINYEREEIKLKKKKKTYLDKILLELHSGKKLEYNYKLENSDHDVNFFILKSVKSYQGNEQINYLPHFTFFLNEYILPDNRKYKIQYHFSDKGSFNYKKVSELKLSVSPEKEQSTYFFNYEKGITTVTDANGNYTKYYYDIEKYRLDKIERYQKGILTPINSDLFIWGNNEREGFLLGKVFFDENKKPVKAIKYIYARDYKGNIEKEIIYGQITGNNNQPIVLDSDNLPIDNEVDKITKAFTYTDNNLIKTQTDQYGVTTEYTYLICKIDGEDFYTNLPTTKFIRHDGKIKHRTFYEYDDNNILIKIIEDNGSNEDKNEFSNATRRFIKKIIPRSSYPYGLTREIEEYYYDFEKNEYKLIKKEKYEYENHKISRKQIFGSDNRYKYSLRYSYDEKDNLILETDPIGREAHYRYDPNNNKIYEEDFSGKIIECEYDLCNRLIKKTILDKDKSYIEEYEYDGKHNKISQKDFYGNVTCYKYDALGNLVEEIFPKVEEENKNPQKTYKYDALSRQIEKIDECKNSTRIFYNIFSKPIKIEYPDNTTEEFYYNLDGTLDIHINQEKTKTKYQYDYLKRIISKKVYSFEENLLTEEIFNYDAFDLVSKTDPDNNNTLFTYDGAGRKVKEEIFDKDNKLLFVEEFYYDELGFECKKVEGKSLVTIFKNDFIGRILEEKKESIFKKELRKINYVYDDLVKSKTINSYIAGKKSYEINFFDLFDRPTKSIDAYGNETTIQYTECYNENLDQKVKRVINTNALKQKTIVTYDALGREKTIEIINPNGKRVSYEEKGYDFNGNLIKQISSIYSTPENLTRTITTKWEYDEMNRLTNMTEAFGTKNSKTTSYSYTKNGLIEKIIKPDQNVLIYEYDQLGNNTRVYSTKRDIDYFFEYNKLNQIVLAKDFNNLITKRKYDLFGNLLDEQLSNGLSISNEYDLLQNKIKTIFQDGSYVEYRYDPLNLREIIRKDKNGYELYKHEYLNYDLSGNLLKENSVFDSKEVDYSFDKLSRVTKIKTKFHTQEAEYDCIGRISKIYWNQFLEDSSDYSYDDLNQVVSETGLFSNHYQFDSHNNRLCKNDDYYTINDLNLIEETQEKIFRYDKNGNPIKKITQNDEIFYEYDSLDRLVRVEKPLHYRLEFSYDPFNRRMSKKVEYGSWLEKDDFRYFLYDYNNEIGSFDKNLYQLELRILSDTKNAEIGSAIAFELNGSVYAPIYDISKNVVSLAYYGSLYEHYRYSAFGEKKIYSIFKSLKCKSQINNPWQFSSKRIDEETGLIFYGRRYYDPELGRWTTSDPKGFQDGFNLYAFVLNNPLIKMDLYGLYATPFMFPNYHKLISRPIPKHERSQILEIIGNSNANNFTYEINGQFNSKKEALENAMILYDNIKHIDKNIAIKPIYTETRGLFLDTLGSIAQRLGIYTPKRVKMIYKELEHQANFALKNGIKQKSFIANFSRGSMDVYQVLERMNQEQRDHFIVFNAGFAKAIPRGFGFIVRNFRSKGDIIPSLMDSFACCNVEGTPYGGFRKVDKYNIDTFTQVDNYPMLDHSFKSQTYQSAFNELFLKFYPKYGANND